MGVEHANLERVSSENVYVEALLIFEQSNVMRESQCVKNVLYTSLISSVVNID
jgi:hypothetical protein